jgi:hypothetical protein
MSKPKILLQFDPDQHASVFDAVVAIDAGADQLLQYSGVAFDRVRDLVHGAMFTRGPQELNNTAIFIGGTDVHQGESLLRQVVECFFGPMRVSVMLDANGANTTAAAAVLAASRHVELRGATATVLGGTGPVGQRAARLLAREGARVKLASRLLERSRATSEAIQSVATDAHITPLQTANLQETIAAIEDAQVIIAAGAAGIELLPAEAAEAASRARVAIDLNAVPPAGIAGIQVMDRAVERNGVVCYGAIGVGGSKMKIHKAAIRRLFERNDLVLNAEEIYAIAREIQP